MVNWEGTRCLAVEMEGASWVEGLWVEEVWAVFHSHVL